MLSTASNEEERHEIVAITASAERRAHLGAADHTLYHGLDSDMTDRLCGAGFAMETFGMTPKGTVWHGLLRDLWLYVASRQFLRRATGEAGVREARA